MKELYTITFIILDPESGLDTSVSISEVSSKEEALEKLKGLMDAENPTLESIIDISEGKKEWNFFVFSQHSREGSISVQLGEEKLEDAILKCQKLTGFADLKLTHVSLPKEEKGDANFNLSREVKNEDGSGDYVSVTVNAKNLASALEKAESVTGLKGFSARAVYVNPRKL